MTESNDGGAEPGPTGEVSTRVSEREVGVEKIAKRHREDSVAVALKLRSARPDRCEVRVRDPLPEPVRDNVVEFHPDYDPTHWSITDGAVVFEAEVEPEAERTMVYGVLIDQPGQLDRFSADPAVEVTVFEDIFEYWSADRTEPPVDPEGPVEPAGAVAAPAGDGAEPPTGGPTGRSDTERERSVVEALVAEVGRRDLSTIEKRELRQAIDLDGVSELERRVGSLSEEVAALQGAVETLEQRLAELDRLEPGLEALSADVERLQAAVERGAHWRSMVHEAVVFDPDEA